MRKKELQKKIHTLEENIRYTNEAFTNRTQKWIWALERIDELEKKHNDYIVFPTPAFTGGTTAAHIEKYRDSRNPRHPSNQW